MKKMPDILRLVGLKVVAVKGISYSLKVKKVEPKYILFSDKKTFIELEEQDYYTSHDCDSSARIISIFQDDGCWERIYKNSNDATIDIGDIGVQFI